MLIKRQNQLGFTLLEVTAVLGIIAVAMLGITSLVTQSLRVENQHQHYVTASMLAQEGIELIRNRRDSNWLNQAIPDWLADGDASNNDIIQDNNYTINYTGLINAGVHSFTDNDSRIFYNTVNGFYSHTSGANTELSAYRRIIETSDNGGNIDATSTVQWTDRSGIKKYEISTKLYDWR